MKKETVKIRKFLPSDLNQIMAIEQSSFTIDAYSRSHFENLYKKHPEGFIVAEIRSKVIGYIIAYISDGIADFDSIAIDPKYRGLGIGKKLINFMITNFRRKGVKKASLEVRTTNKTATSFFQNLGFKIKRILKDFYRDRGDAYQMGKEI